MQRKKKNTGSHRSRAEFLHPKMLKSESQDRDDVFILSFLYIHHAQFVETPSFAGEQRPEKEPECLRPGSSSERMHVYSGLKAIKTKERRPESHQRKMCSLRQRTFFLCADGKQLSEDDEMDRERMRSTARCWKK